jgi:hypothetical protein
MTCPCKALWAVSITIVFLLLVPPHAQAEMVLDVQNSIYHRGVYFDADRFPDSVLLDFINDAQTLIATISKTKQAETTYVCGAGYKYPLPSDYYLFWGAILNANPNPVTGEPTPVPYYLDYVPPEKYGSVAFQGDDRPSSYTVWGDSLLLNRPSYSETDTITFYYLAEPTVLTEDSSVIDLPSAFIPLLKDAVEYMCINRITYPGRSEREAVLQLTGYLNEAILGRPKDAP